MSTDPSRPTRADIAEQIRVVRAAQDDVDALLAADPSAPADEAPPLLAEVWTVWCEDESAWGYFATEDAGKTGTIDYYEEQEERCPDYGWQQDGPRLELLAGGELTGIYLNRHPVYGKPAPADRATTLHEAADAVALERDSTLPGSGKGAWRRGMTHAETLLRRMADEVQQPGEGR